MPAIRSPAFLLLSLGLLGLASPTAVGAERALTLPLWPDKAPDEGDYQAVERVRMSPKLDRTQVEVTESTRLITGVTVPTVTLQRPAAASDTGTAILICPGGGYWDLYWELEGEEVAAWLNSIGVTGILLKYRVPRRPGEPEGKPARRPLQDAQRAIRLVRSRSQEWGIMHLGIVGFSAGGHLSMAAATQFDRQTYPPQDTIDGLSAKPDFAIAVYPGYLKASDKPELSPDFSVPSGTPPVFLAHGDADLISSPEHSLVMYRALRGAGVPAELHIYAGAAHDFGVRKSSRPCSAWTTACASWLRQQAFVPAAGPPER